MTSKPICRGLVHTPRAEGRKPEKCRKWEPEPGDSRARLRVLTEFLYRTLRFFSAVLNLAPPPADSPICHPRRASLARRAIGMTMEEMAGAHCCVFRLLAAVRIWEKCSFDRYCSRPFENLFFGAKF